MTTSPLRPTGYRHGLQPIGMGRVQLCLAIYRESDNCRAKSREVFSETGFCAPGPHAENAVYQALSRLSAGHFRLGRHPPRVSISDLSEL